MPKGGKLTGGVTSTRTRPAKQKQAFPEYADRRPRPDQGQTVSRSTRSCHPHPRETLRSDRWRPNWMVLCLCSGPWRLKDCVLR